MGTLTSRYVRVRLAEAIVCTSALILEVGPEARLTARRTDKIHAVNVLRARNGERVVRVLQELRATCVDLRERDVRGVPRQAAVPGRWLDMCCTQRTSESYRGENAA
ncbi:hypothetical protein BD413DRAFT_573783 [Trametes elegans]|nr:hypothetical protein BD413DRAFT_573783 [Trametes elegans]